MRYRNETRQGVSHSYYLITTILLVSSLLLGVALFAADMLV